MSEHHGLRRRIIIIIACVAALAIAALVALEWLRPSVVRRVGGPIQEVAEALTPGLSRYVVIVSIDGLRADAIEAYPTPTLHRLMRTGRYTLEARTVVPSKTLPAHTSMLTGAAVARHGVTWNEARPDSARRVPTIFERARRTGLSTAAFFSKPKFEGLASGDGFDYVQRPVGGVIGMLADEVDDDVEDALREHHPHLLFVHIADPDYAGHLTGWMTRLYGRAVSSADAALDDILESADEAYGEGEYTIIVTADHGGHGRDHTGAVPEDVLIPWIVAGKGVAGVGRIAEPVTIMDTGATALWLLGLAVDADLEGRAIRSAFDKPSLISPEFPELISPSSVTPSSIR
ncbi:MAG: alkaline phosphatase family protein [Longimicrobiales bacterium]